MPYNNFLSQNHLKNSNHSISQPLDPMVSNDKKVDRFKSNLRKFNAIKSIFAVQGSLQNASKFDA
jgi:hypothetical protein